MSADNVLYIQRRKKKWWVWMGFVSDEKRSKPNKKRDIWFKNKDTALAYALGWLRGEDIIEYGVVELDPKL